MYWYLKNLHNETISRNNVTKFRKRKYKEVSRNFAKLKSLSSLFRISRNKKILVLAVLSVLHESYPLSNIVALKRAILQFLKLSANLSLE
jgi:hypothetical protein